MSFTNTIDRAYAATRRDVRHNEDEVKTECCGLYVLPPLPAGRIIYSRCSEPGCGTKACDECCDETIFGCAECCVQLCAEHLTEDSRGKLCAACERIADEELQLIAQSLERLALDIRERRVLPSRVAELLDEFAEDTRKAA